jgi:hypothetical protein
MQIVVGDPPLADRACRYNGAAEVPGYAQGTCPVMTKSNRQCAPDLLWTGSGTGEVRKTMEDCAKLDMGAGGCRLPDLQQMSCKIVDGLNELQKLRKYTELLETEINPLLRCEFVKEIFAGMYMPLCVDAVAGFGRVTAANFLGARPPPSHTGQGRAGQAGRPACVAPRTHMWRWHHICVPRRHINACILS